MAKIRIFRYRRPSVNTMLGITRAKKRVKKDLGITAAMRPFRAPGNMKRRGLRRAGYYGGPMKFMRFLGRIFLVAAVLSSRFQPARSSTIL